MNCRLALLTLLLALVASAPAGAHEYWLSTAPSRPAAGDTIAVRALVGMGFAGDVRPWQRERALRFERSDVVGAVTPDSARVARDSVWARVVARAEGTLVWYESNFIGIELPADEFDAYLKEEGLDDPLDARSKLGQKRGPGRERYRRACKAWIAGADTAQLSAVRNLPLEIVTLNDPGSARPLHLRVLAAGTPVEGALVRAWRQPPGSDPSRREAVERTIEGRTGTNGEIVLTLSGSGEWLVSTVRMIPSARPDEADWESTWASLTFHR